MMVRFEDFQIVSEAHGVLIPGDRARELLAQSNIHVRLQGVKELSKNPDEYKRQVYHEIEKYLMLVQAIPMSEFAYTTGD